MVDDVIKQVNEILGRVIVIETKIDTYNDTRTKVDCAYNQSMNNKDDILELKENNKWLWRTVVSAIIVSFLGAFLTWAS